MIEYKVKVSPAGRQEWYLNGNRHREDGPAIVCPNGRQEWYLKGEELSEEEFNNRNKAELTLEDFDKYEAPDEISWSTIEPLKFLYGKVWGQPILNYIHSLRPSCIRVTKGGVKLDSKTWRVTVVLNDDDTVREIYQEVEVGCVGFEDASDMDNQYLH
jgi:hypothetical protein